MRILLADSSRDSDRRPDKESEVRRSAMSATSQSHKIQVVIADDHALFRASIRTILAEQPDLSVVGEAEDGTGLCQLIRDTKADVLLLDLDMPRIDGHEVLRHLKNSRSKVNTLVLTASENRLDLSLALELGAKGVVPKRAGSSTLLEAIRRVEQGKSWVDPQFRDLVPEPKHEPVRRRYRQYERPEDNGPQWSSLTPRERQIASLVAQGNRYKKIAKRLQISDQTVRNHLRNIFEKLQINDRVQLALFTLQRNN